MKRRLKKKKQKQQQYPQIKGISTQDILSMSDADISKLSKGDLYKLTQRLADTANKRIRRLQKADENTPALQSIMGSGGLFRLKGMNRNELLSQFARAKNFLEMKASSTRAAKKIRSEFEKYVEQKLSDIQIGHFWTIFHRLEKDRAADIKNRYQSAQQMVAEIIADNNRTDYDNLTDDEKSDLWDELFALAEHKLTVGYEELKELEETEEDELRNKFNAGGSKKSRRYRKNTR